MAKKKKAAKATAPKKTQPKKKTAKKVPPIAKNPKKALTTQLKKAGVGKNIVQMGKPVCDVDGDLGGCMTLEEAKKIIQEHQDKHPLHNVDVDNC